MLIDLLGPHRHGCRTSPSTNRSQSRPTRCAA
jgi:hypothetical protein